MDSSDSPEIDGNERKESTANDPAKAESGHKIATDRYSLPAYLQEDDDGSADGENQSDDEEEEEEDQDGK